VQAILPDAYAAPIAGFVFFCGSALLLIVGTVLLGGPVEILGRRFGDKVFPPDFSIQVLRERFQRKVQRAGGSAVVVLLLSGGVALAVRSVLGFPGMPISVFIRWALVFLLLGYALILASGIWVVARHGSTPDSAHVLFGWRAAARKAVETGFSLIIAVVLTMLVLQTMVYFLEVRPRRALAEVENLVGSDPAFLTLERSDRPEDWELYQWAIEGVETGREFSNLTHNNLKRIVYSILRGVLIAAFVLLPLVALAIGLIGRPLERYLARRMDLPQGGSR
jgi:hypothetical protein